MSATALEPRRQVLRRARAAELSRTAVDLTVGVVPWILTVYILLPALRHDWVAYDFHQSYYPAVVRLLHGGNPYAVSHADVVAGAAFVYPALSAVALVPFGLLGGASDHAYMLFCLLLVPATLWAAGLRDWRVYGIVLAWRPIVVGWQGGNMSIPLAFLVALTWRYRDRPWAAGLATAVAVSLKPFVWPLGLWFLATRRWKAAAWACVWGVIVNLLTWAIVGFDEIHTYLRLSGQVTDALWRGGYSLLAVAHHLGFGRGVGEVVLVVVSVGVGLVVIYYGFYLRREREAMVLAVAMMLVASPLVWNHYFVLLVLPLALMRPRFSPIWIVPTALWACPPSITVVGWQAAVAWAVAVSCFVQALRTGWLVAQRPTPAAGHRARSKF